jgi:hypothetical protein
VAGIPLATARLKPKGKAIRDTTNPAKRFLGRDDMN